jgi:hypothetical protein
MRPCSLREVFKGNLIREVDAKRYGSVRLVPSSQVTVITGNATRSDITCLRVTTAIPGAALVRAR